MGIGGISWPQILVVLVIVLLIFGTKRIRNIGSDLGGAIREFRKGVGESDDESGDQKSAETKSTESQSSEHSSEKNPDKGKSTKKSSKGGKKRDGSPSSREH